MSGYVCDMYEVRRSRITWVLVGLTLGCQHRSKHTLTAPFCEPTDNSVKQIITVCIQTLALNHPLQSNVYIYISTVSNLQESEV